MGNGRRARKQRHMAVSNHEYFAQYKRSTLTYVVLVQIISALISSGAAIFTWMMLDAAPLNALAISAVVLIICNVAASFVLFTTLSTPLRLLAAAIAHVSKDPVVTPPPRLDAKKYETSGLKALVQTVYELAAQPEQPQPQPTTQPTAIFKELADDLPCGLFALDAKGHVMYANNLAPTKVNADGARASTLIFDLQDTFDDWLVQADKTKVRDTRTWQRIADRLPGAPDRRIFDIVAYYQKDNPAGVAAIVVAVDRTKNYAMDQEDMDFIALAAHELRGPITVIRGYLDVIKGDLGATFSADQQELFDRLQVSSERLAGYINNILNVSRYDRKQFQVHLHEESLMDVLKTLVPDLALRARTQHRTLVFKIPQGLPSIAADRSSLGEVVTNLIDNAIKYSHEGGEILITAAPKDGQWVELTVQDHGIGMPESVMGGLFSKFYRSHRSRQSVGGTGLGLYICKAIVEAHGGSIWVRSIEGEGSTFGFTVPIYATVATKLAAGDNQNKDIVQRPEGWIKNHAMYRR